jgi:hypothetical protein
MTSPRQRLGALLALLAMFLTVPHGLVVLCSGEDGHVAIEFAEVAAHAEAHEADPCLAQELCGCGSPCGPCTDAPLGNDASFHPAKPRESGVSPDVPGVAPIAWTPPAPPLAPSPHSILGHVVSSARSTSRTIVLRN